MLRGACTESAEIVGSGIIRHDLLNLTVYVRSDGIVERAFLRVLDLD
jgi:hypothetical protein